MKKIYIKRLQHLAEYLLEAHDMMVLAPQTIIFHDEEKHIGYECKYHAWVFLDLPWIFPGFRFESEMYLSARDYGTELESVVSIDANPVSEFVSLGSLQNPFRAGTVSSMLHHLNLTPEEFLHLFGTGKRVQQPEKYGGMFYPEWHSIESRHIAVNILEFIKNKRNMNTRNKKQYSALRTFADFLQHQTEPTEKEVSVITMKQKFKGGGYKKAFLVQRWVFNLLPDCFEQWYFDSTDGEPKYGPAESTDTISDVFSWFELENIEDFGALFSDKGTGANSSCKQISESITTWLEEKCGKG